MKNGEVKVTFDGLKKLKETMKALAVTDVFVGIPAQDKERKDDGEEEHMNNATLGYIHEKGSDLAGIPPRPHLIPGIKKVQKEIAEEFKKAAQAAFTDTGAMMKNYNRAGIIASNSVKKIITDQEGFKELSYSTIAAREADGKKGTKALIRTGQLRNAYTYTIGESVKGKG